MTFCKTILLIVLLISSISIRAEIDDMTCKGIIASDFSWSNIGEGRIIQGQDMSIYRIVNGKLYINDGEQDYLYSDIKKKDGAYNRYVVNYKEWVIEEIDGNKISLDEVHIDGFGFQARRLECIKHPVD